MKTLATIAILALFGKAALAQDTPNNSQDSPQGNQVEVKVSRDAMGEGDFPKRGD